MQLQSNHASRATNILTCLILPYTALQNKHVLTCGDYISGVEGMPHVQKQSLSKFLSALTTGCLVLDIRCAERSTHIRPTTSNSKTCSRATIPICSAAQNLKLRYFTLSVPAEKRWSLTITKCKAEKHTGWRHGHKGLTTLLPLPPIQLSTSIANNKWLHACITSLTPDSLWLGVPPPTTLPSSLLHYRASINSRTHTTRAEGDGDLALHVLH